VDDRADAQATAAAAYGQLPLSFEANQGQADPAVDFVAHAQGYALALNAREAVLSLHKNAAKQTGVDVEMPEPANVLHVQLNGADPRAPLVAQDLLPGTANYFIGNDPAQWHSAIPTYARVGYRTIYPGVDLVYYGHQGQLENDFVVAPGADPSRIRLAFDGADGFDVDATGALVIHTAGGDVRLQAPVIYQEGSDRQAVSGTYVLTDVAEVGFAVGAYDAAKPLIIDPVLVYSTFLGGLGDASGEGDLARGIAVDAAGNAYVAGRTGSSDFPTTPGALQGTLGGSPDVFVTKLNATGTALVYSTFLGGSGFEDGLGIALDPAGNAYVTGSTGSSDFPTTPGAYQRTSHGADAFVTELNATGTALVYSTLLGRGSESRSIAVDAAGNAYVTGTTLFADFPTTPGAFQRTLRGFPAAFVTKLNATGSALVYSALLGGTTETETGSSRVAVDADGSAYIAGGTFSSDFPTTPGAFQRTLRGASDVFVTKLNPTGASLVFSTLLGGSSSSQSEATLTLSNPALPGTPLPHLAIAVDRAGRAYVAGFTDSADFPVTPGAVQRTLAGGGDAFVTRIEPGPPGCTVAAVLAGPPTQLRVQVHADRGLATLTVTQAANVSVDLPAFAPGTSDTLLVTGTKLDQTARASLTLRATDVTGASTECDPSLVAVGRAPGDSPVRVIHHVARAESHVSITNGTPGVQSLRLLVNGRDFEVMDLHHGETRSVDVSSAMHKGGDNIILVIAHGPRGGSAAVLVSDS
jgi:hypothetical protein